MSKRMTKHTLDERIQAVLSVVDSKRPVHTVARDYGVNQTTIQSWVRKYEADGVDGLKKKELEKIFTGIKNAGSRVLPKWRSWIETERKRLQQIFIRGAEKLAQIHVRLQQFNQCINWCERILELDNTWEEAYRLLMYCYYQNNNRPQAMKWYDQCCKVLEEELGIEPMEPTKEMYEMIIEAEELEIY